MDRSQVTATVVGVAVVNDELLSTTTLQSIPPVYMERVHTSVRHYVVDSLCGTITSFQGGTFALERIL